jgi:methionine sulfoxide reductase heme-binding subunit
MTATAAPRAARARPTPLPWLDRAGRLSWLKLAVFLATLAPGLWIAGKLGLGTMGAKPLTAAIHGTGDWAVRFLVASLAVTPLRRIADWPQLILVRRMVGLAALAYAVIHLGLYVVDQGFDLARVATEIALRVYLTVGFVALLGLAVLGATSTDATIRRMGAAWHRLHRVVYALTALALLHYFMQTKLEVSSPVLWSGYLLLFLGHRLMHRAGLPTNPATLVGLALAAALASALVEAAWYKLATSVPVPFLDILAQNLDLSYEVRPPWWVLGAGLALAAVNLVRGGRSGRRSKAGRTTGETAGRTAQMTLASGSGRPAATRP